jgi:NADH-quinone oxidoreductase subunit L
VSGPSNHILIDMEHVPTFISLLPTLTGIVGIALAYAMYWVFPEIPGKLATQFGGIYRFLLNKWYFDELYDKLFVRPAVRIGRGLWKGGDGAIIDGIGPDGIAATTIRLARRASQLQTGYVYHYAFAMLVGIAGFVTWYLVVRAG